MAEARYFFISPPAGEPGIVSLDGAEFHHLANVCRVRAGERVWLLDGRGTIYDALVELVGPREARLRVTRATHAPAQPPVDIALAVLKAPRFDLALEKCTEIGVRRFVPFAAARSVWRADPSSAGAKLERMKRKVAAACKQSGQPYLPAVEEVSDFDGLVSRLGAYERVFVAERDAVLAQAGAGASGGPVLGIVGPEGGFEPEEARSLAGAGAVELSLGPFRLRSETAAVCLVYRLVSDFFAAGAVGAVGATP
jgi:16S rRNA (uracil1498-N3)-methyltransferase